MTELTTIDQSRAEYDSLPFVNPSLLMYATKSLKHFRAAQLGDITSDTSDAKQLGDFSHKALLEPHIDLTKEVKRQMLEPGTTDFAIWTGKVRNGRAWAEFQEDNAEKTIIRQQDLDAAYDRAKTAITVSKAVLANTTAAALLEGTKTEQTVTCELCEVMCKGRMDAYKPGVIVDLKTCRDPSNYAFGKQCAQLRYNVRLGCYRAFVEAVNGQRPEVWLIAAETSPPYDVAVYRPPEQFLDNGWLVAEKALKAIAEAERTDYWPGVCESSEILYVPNWAMEEQEADLVDWGA